jgi:hypothetical protein
MPKQSGRATRNTMRPEKKSFLKLNDVCFSIRN